MKVLAEIGLTFLSIIALAIGVYFFCSCIENTGVGSRLKEILVCSLYGCLIGFISSKIFDYFLNDESKKSE